MNRLVADSIINRVYEQRKERTAAIRTLRANGFMVASFDRTFEQNDGSKVTLHFIRELNVPAQEV